MTPTYDYSVTDMKEHNFEFGNLSLVEILQKKNEWEAFSKSKVVEAPPQATDAKPPAPPQATGAKPVFRPKIKPAGS